MWTLYTRVAVHNHEASGSRDAHPSLRSLDPDQQDQLSALSQAGVKPRNIAIALRNMANTPYEHPLTVRDVYNARHRLRIDALAGQTPIQALFHQFTTEDFFWEYQASDTGHITHLFLLLSRRLTLSKTILKSYCWIVLTKLTALAFPYLTSLALQGYEQLSILLLRFSRLKLRLTSLGLWSSLRKFCHLHQTCLLLTVILPL